MKERIKTILFIFSVAVNLGILGFLAYSWSLPHFLRGENRWEQPEEIMPFTGEQASQVRKARERLMCGVRGKRLEIQTKRNELFDLLMRPAPDPRAVNSKVREINQLQGAIQEDAANEMLLETGQMTPEQKKSYFTSIRNRMCGQGMIPGGVGQWCGKGRMMGRR